MKIKIEVEIEVSEKNESTSAPYWLILDPRGGFVSKNTITEAITGHFFSRESADDHLESRRYAFGKKPFVYCFSGHSSKEYCNAIEKAGGKNIL